MRESLQRYYLDTVCSHHPSLLQRCLRAVLSVITPLYAAVIFFRNKAYDLQWLSSEQLHHCTTVSIGNITVGGTGKTPFTLLLAQSLQPRASVAIVARGYRSEAETLQHPIILSRGSGPEYSASYCGDEPFLLASNLKNVMVIVGRDRVKGRKIAIQEGAQVVLLDDAMQHRQIGRDSDVVVVDAREPFGYGKLLPRGLLREPLHGISRASLVVINHVANHKQYVAIQQMVQRYSAAPTIGTRLLCEEIVTYQNETLRELQGKRVGIFCGIAHPTSFRETVEQLGCEIVAERYFSDHVSFNKVTLRDFENHCLNQKAEILLCTEKDAVKLQDTTFQLPLAWLKMRLCVVEDKDNWNVFLDDVLKKVV